MNPATELNTEQLAKLFRSGILSENQIAGIIRDLKTSSNFDNHNIQGDLNQNPNLARRNKITLIKLIRQWVSVNEFDKSMNGLAAAKKFVEDYFHCD